MQKFSRYVIFVDFAFNTATEKVHVKSMNKISQRATMTSTLKGGLHEIFDVIFLHQYIVYVMCLMFVRFVFENKNNLLVKKRVEKQDSKPIYGFFRFAVLLLMTSQV